MYLAPLAPEHRDRVAEILRATGAFRGEEVAVALELFDETYGLVPGTGSGYQVPDAAGRDADYHFIGAFTSTGDLAGYACYGATPGTDRTHDLYWIAVDPRAQGVGAGTLLLAEVERRLRAGGARLLVVETSGRADYEPARRFYAARDYAEVARVRDFYAVGDDRVVLTKRLSQGSSPDSHRHTRSARPGAE
jgi:ribosomal protein S18 acetylase RimI-like enzyme